MNVGNAKAGSTDNTGIYTAGGRIDSFAMGDVNVNERG
jgi:hypothetical protein